MEDIKKVALYVRSGPLEIDQADTAMQSELLYKFCNAQGWEVVATYVDEGLPASEPRPSLSMLFRDLFWRRHHLHAVVMRDPSRLAQTNSELLAFGWEICECGIETIFADGPRPDEFLTWLRTEDMASARMLDATKTPLPFGRTSR